MGHDQHQSGSSCNVSGSFKWNATPPSCFAQYSNGNYDRRHGFQGQRFSDTRELSVFSIVLLSRQDLVETPQSSRELEGRCGSFCAGHYRTGISHNRNRRVADSTRGSARPRVPYNRSYLFYTGGLSCGLYLSCRERKEGIRLLPFTALQLNLKHIGSWRRVNLQEKHSITCACNVQCFYSFFFAQILVVNNDCIGTRKARL